MILTDGRLFKSTMSGSSSGVASVMTDLPFSSRFFQLRTFVEAFVGRGGVDDEVGDFGDVREDKERRIEGRMFSVGGVVNSSSVELNEADSSRSEIFGVVVRGERTRVKDFQPVDMLWVRARTGMGSDGTVGGGEGSFGGVERSVAYPFVPFRFVPFVTASDFARFRPNRALTTTKARRKVAGVAVRR